MSSTSASQGGLGALDVTIVVASIVAVFVIGFMASRNKSRGGTDAAEYFLAGRGTSWWLCAASLFASNIGSEHFVGQAGTAAASGLAVAIYEWQAAFFLLLLGWVFAPIYLRLALTTTPQYLERRFSLPCRLVVVAITLANYVTSKIAAGLYAGAILLEVTAGLGMWVSAPLIILATGAYTVSGGLHAVLWTDALQMVIFVFGGAVGAGVALSAVGGQAGLFRTMASAGFPAYRHLVRPADDAALPGAGMLLGQLVSSTWYWCLDHEMAQRVLSCRGPAHARLGSAAAALLKVLPVFIVVFPGMCARALYESCRASGGARHPTWCSVDLRDPEAANRAYPLLVVREFPPGLKGLMVAAFLAAMMSSLSAVFNSASTVFTYDVFWRALAQRGGESADRAGHVELSERAVSSPDMEGGRRVSAGSPGDAGERDPREPSPVLFRNALWDDDEGDEGALGGATPPLGGVGSSPLRPRSPSPAWEAVKLGEGTEEPTVRVAGAGSGGGADRRVPTAAEQRTLVHVGRLATAAMVVFSLLWLPVIRGQHGQLYLVAMSATLHLAPSVVAVFVLGVAWSRANAQGALAGLVTGAVLGATQLGVSMARHGYCATRVRPTPDGRAALHLAGWDWLSCLHFQYWTLILTGVSAAVTVAVSLATPPPPEERLEACLAGGGGVRAWLSGYRRFGAEESPLSPGEKGKEVEREEGGGGAPPLEQRWVSRAGVAVSGIAVGTIVTLFAVYW